jgi:hypothetical protein
MSRARARRAAAGDPVSGADDPYSELDEDWLAGYLEENS